MNWRQLALVLALVWAPAAFAERPLLSFGFLTDTHVGETDESCALVRSALTLFREKGVSLIVHSGDIADRHADGRYRAYRRTFESVFAGTDAPLQLVAGGNHDLFDVKPKDWPAAYDKLLLTLGAMNTHTDEKVVGGYAFLVMPYPVGKEGFLSWDEYERRVSAACAAHPGDPVFVVQHVPPQDTVYNSHAWGDANVRRILNRYPQVVNLSGHVHGSLRNDQFLWQGEFTVVNACCMQHWNGLLGGKPAPNAKFVHDVLTVEVYRNRLVARRWNACDGREIDAGHPWTIPLPFDARTAPYDRTRLSAEEKVPQYAADARLELASPGIVFSGIDVTFPELSGNVMTYVLAVRSPKGEVLREKEVFSNFWRDPENRKPTQTVHFDVKELGAAERYEVSVCPVGQYGTRGKPLVGFVAGKKGNPGSAGGHDRLGACYTRQVAGRPDYFVDYVASDGRQVIDTGVAARTGVRAAGEMAWLRTGNGEETYLGAAPNGKRCYLLHRVGGYVWYGYGATRHYPVDENGGRFLFEPLRRHRFETDYTSASQLRATLDGRQVWSDAKTEKVANKTTLLLFGSNMGTDEPAYAARARFYGLKIWLDGKLVRDLRPCVKNGEGGLYDAVRDEMLFPWAPFDPAHGVGNRCPEP